MTRKTPTPLKLIKGNPGKRRLPRNEPKPEPSLPEAPEHLGDAAKAEWQRVAPQLARVGLLTDLDRNALAAYADAFADWATARRALEVERAKEGGGLVRTMASGNLRPSPLVEIARAARADMVRFAHEFGMTPSARAGMDLGTGGAPPPPPGKPTGKPDYYG